jgi:hypothetical protein
MSNTNFLDSLLSINLVYSTNKVGLLICVGNNTLMLNVRVSTKVFLVVSLLARASCA